MPTYVHEYAASDHVLYDYAMIRIIPDVRRGECLNVGVILFSRMRRFLAARVQSDVERLQTFAPALSSATAARTIAHIEQFPLICAGAGPIGALEQAERFHWLVAPRSVIIQASPFTAASAPTPQKRLTNCSSSSSTIRDRTFACTAKISS